MHIILGPPCSVLTEQSETQRWLQQALQEHSFPGSNWWEQPSSESPLGILLGFEEDGPKIDESPPRVTEILIYATTKPKVLNAPPTPPTTGDRHAARHDLPHSWQPLSLKAIALSSDLLHINEDAQDTPPQIPSCELDEIDAIFLSPSHTPTTEIVHEPPIKRRKTAADAFDAANERRRQFRRQGHALSTGPSVQEPTEPSLPSIRHRRPTSSNTNVLTASRADSHSRSPSVVCTKPLLAQPSKSSLSRAQSISHADQEQNAVESNNKELISRIVMAGMRLYGFVQRKNSRHVSKSSEAKIALDEVSLSQDIEATRKNDKEFKLVYHQVYKGVCFALRASISEHALLPHSNAIREIADRFLAIFCSDPLASEASAQQPSTQLTPGGRRPFGQHAVMDRGQGSFAVTPG